ncbi:MAG TPA: hypothetical protein VGC45_12375 [Gryllotalpicola sp.]
MHYSDLALLADELAGYGPEAVVIEPDHLKQAVVSRLEATKWAHEAHDAREGGAA